MRYKRIRSKRSLSHSEYLSPFIEASKKPKRANYTARNVTRMLPFGYFDNHPNPTTL